MKIFRNLRSLLPIPGRWSDEGKSFALKVEDAYKWLQTQMSNDRDNTEASKAKKIQLTNSDDSWEKVWEKISVLDDGETATFYASGNAMDALTDGVRTVQGVGIISRYSSSQFQLIYRPSYQYIYTGLLTSASSSGATYQDSILANTGQLSNLTTSTKTNLVAAINEVNGKILSDTILYQASAASHTFKASNNSRNIIIHTGDGATRTYIAMVYCGSGGAITLNEIYKGGNVTSVTTSTNNRITITMGSATAVYARIINIRGDPISN